MLPNERYKIVPTELVANLKFRRALLKRCHTDIAFRNAVIEVCREDCLFWFNAFCWIFEPRPKKLGNLTAPNQMPFIAWEHQVPEILTIREHLGFSDIGVEKSRGEGMSWLSVLFAMRDFTLNPNTAIGMISKDEDAANDPNNQDSLIWKCIFTLEKLPPWMGGKRDVDWKHDTGRGVLRNLRNGSTIATFAATGNAASGGRKAYFVMDELSKFPRPADRDVMASTQHVTNSRLIVSTPKGSEGAYYDVMHSPTNMVRVVLDWKKNPTRNRGLYQLVDGRPVAIDPINNPLPQNYIDLSDDVLDMYSRLRRKGFKLEGKERSPWYDRECDRPGATPQNIAQELDRDYGGSAYRVFGNQFMSKFEKACMPVVKVGDMNFNRETLESVSFMESDGGPLKLWIPLDTVGRPPRSIYTLGCDVSAGTGGSYSSNSTIVGIDSTTGEQVLEFAANTVPPTEFADLAIAIAKWLGDAYLCWESNGPGTAFSKRVFERKYFNIFYRKVEWRRGDQKTKEAGWWTDDRSKEILFEQMQTAVLLGDVVFRSNELLKECGQYVRKEGKIVHALVKNASDDSKGASHGDRVIGAGVAIVGMKDRPVSKDSQMQEAPLGSVARRLQEYEEQQRREREDWDNDSFSDWYAA